MRPSYSGSVGVVTPFREQADRIRRFLASDNALQGWANAHGCIMETAHRYQGDERDAIIFSPVISRGTPDISLRFLGTNGHLFNVAIARARATLIVVGDKTAAKKSGVRYLADFADYVDRANDSHAEATDLPARALSMTSPLQAIPRCATLTKCPNGSASSTAPSAPPGSSLFPSTRSIATTSTLRSSPKAGRVKSAGSTSKSTVSATTRTGTGN